MPPLADRTRTGRWLIVLDEINWLGMRDASFLGKLKNAWDLRLSKNPHLILILSGSVTSWIEREILHMTLCELPLFICNKFWGAQAPRVSSYEKFRMLAVTGGIPRYLEEMNPTLSVVSPIAS